MDIPMNLDSREQALTLELMEALSSSLELSEALRRSRGPLCQLLPADHVALCVSDSRPSHSTNYEWLVTDPASALFSRYRELSAEDFVRAAVVLRPNVVLRDSEMLPRKQLTRSPLYLRCRELGMPLEHVMSVLLDVNLEWHGGLSLYRERPRPFSERHQSLLQRLTPLLARTVRNCRMFGAVATGGQILDALFHQGATYLVLEPPAIERMRTTKATALIAKWFTPSECAASGLPRPLLERLAFLVGMQGRAELETDTWVRWGTDQNLKVTFVQLPMQEGRRPWALVFQELSQAIFLPTDWRRRITGREAQVLECVLRNWHNDLIAQELGISSQTVKKHMGHIFRKLGLESRADLMYQVAWHQKPV